MAIEIEKKYRLDKKLLVEMAAKLRELKAVFTADVFEENYLHRGGLLDERNAVLRVRKTGDKTLLTYKEKVGTSPDGDFKHKIEFETMVTDVEATEHIIEKLGYRLSVVYEKHRKSWQRRGRPGRASVRLLHGDRGSDRGHHRGRKATRCGPFRT